MKRLLNFKKTFYVLILIIISVLTTVFLSSCGEEKTVALDEKLYAELLKLKSDEITLDSYTAVKAARNMAWEEYRETERKSENRVNEITSKSIKYGEVTMKYEMTVIGEPGPDGYPLYIALHGGGGSDTPDMNDSQWEGMKYYYKESVVSGIYLAPRGVRDTWDTHFNPESYPLYERLIENLSIYYGIDTNRVYLVGYSAGGDGVYQITPRLADRFAAANMSAGHPNGVNLTNLYNVPFQIQCGDADTAYNRNKEDARYAIVLEDLKKQYSGGFIYNVNIHLGKGHGITDNDPDKTPQMVYQNPALWYNGERSGTVTVDANAISFLEKYTRDPIPKKVVWNLEMRPNQSDTESFYWLRAEKSVNKGIVTAEYDKKTNTVTIEAENLNGALGIMLNEEMVDLFAPVTVIFNGETTVHNVTPSLEIINKTISERSDPNMIFAAEITIG